MQDNLSRLLRPRHIAFIGGTQAEGPLLATQRAGFSGEIWAVNPNKQDLGGVETVPHVTDLPAAPDAAVLALSPERTIEAVEALSALGASGAAAITSGFSEIGADGAALQQRLVEAAGEMAVLGPNCMGALNQFDGAAVWGTNNHMERVGSPGAALISQSGAFLFGITNVEQGLPLGYAISIGNQAIVDAADCIHAVLDDPRVRSIGLYLEGVSDGVALGKACLRALRQGIPVVALKGGETPTGQEIAITHTASMVVESDIWRAFTSRYGVASVSSPKALVETVKLLAVSGIPAGRQLSAITFSGGLNGLLAARSSHLGIDLAQPDEAGRKVMEDILPIGVPIRNPLDLNLPFRSSSGIDMTHTDAVTELIVAMTDGIGDILTFFIDVPRPDENDLGADWLHGVDATIQAHQKLGLPTVVAGILPEGLDVELRHRLLGEGISPLLGFSETLEAISAAVAIGEAQRRIDDVVPLLAVIPGHIPTTHNEVESKQMLGLERPDSMTVAPSDVTRAVRELGLPVAVKIVSDDVIHKSQVGGVALGLETIEEVEAAVASMPRTDAVLVEKMIENPVAELIVGVKRAGTFGIAMMIGVGGTSTESISDYTTVLLPADEFTLRSALTNIGMAGHRGVRAAVDAVASFALANVPLSLDVNPLIVTGDGRAVAADALIVMEE